MCNFVYVPQYKCALPRFAIGQDFQMILRKLIAESASNKLDLRLLYITEETIPLRSL